MVLENILPFSAPFKWFNYLGGSGTEDEIPLAKSSSVELNSVLKYRIPEYLEHSIPT